MASIYSGQSPYRDSSKNRRRNTLAYISIAVVFILLTGITYFITQPAGKRQLAKNIYTAPLPQMQRTNSLPEDSLYQKGMMAFGREDWKKALAAFEKIDTSYLFYQRSLYFAAHAFVGEKNYDKALELFSNPVFQQGQYAQHAEWNRLMMLMFLNHPDEEIIRELSKIANSPDHFYSGKARELLKRLQVNQ